MLTVYTLEQAEGWDALVRSFQQYDVYHLSGYGKAFQLHGDGEPLLLYGEAAGVRGFHVVMKRDIADDPRFAGKLEPGQLFDFATPYGYGGWLLEGEGDSAPILAAYGDWCRAHHVVSEFVRFHPVLENYGRVEAAYEICALGASIAMDLSSPEIIWGNLSSKNRNVIRKAKKNGVQVFSGRSPELYETFRTLYNATMEQDRAEPYYYFSPAFYQSMLNDLPHNAQVFYAQMEDGTVIAASILLAANGRLNYHLSGSRREFQSLAPTNLLLYEAALWGCANGCRTFHLGGGLGFREDSLYQFKKAFFRGGPCCYHIGRRVYLEDAYQTLLAMRGELPEGGFFPRYRA